jgi:hypothetical protein
VGRKKGIRVCVARPTYLIYCVELSRERGSQRNINAANHKRMAATLTKVKSRFLFFYYYMLQSRPIAQQCKEPTAPNMTVPLLNRNLARMLNWDDRNLFIFKVLDFSYWDSFFLSSSGSSHVDRDQRPADHAIPPSPLVYCLACNEFKSSFKSLCSFGPPSFSRLCIGSGCSECSHLIYLVSSRWLKAKNNDLFNW